MKNLPQVTVGLDLGDKECAVCIIDADGTTVREDRVRTTATALRHLFEGLEHARVVLEVGAHSPWISRLLNAVGHEVFVANPRRVRAIYENKRKSDRFDARMLARIGRLDPKLLHPVKHREEQAQADRAILMSRDLLVRARSQLIVHVRGVVKAFGGRIDKCTTAAFHNKALEQIPEQLHPALAPLVEQIGKLSEQIRNYDNTIDKLADERYPETITLRQIDGVGALTALAYVLTIEDPLRFTKSRSVGAYLGLVPRLDQTGRSDPELRITRAGDPFLRRLLVQAAHYILGPFGKHCDLRRHGERIAGSSKNAKKRAVIAVARKLAVLMHKLWVNGQPYDPDKIQKQMGALAEHMAAQPAA